MFTASVDTSSVMWAMELNRKPAVLRKVLDEIHATVGGKLRTACTSTTCPSSGTSSGW